MTSIYSISDIENAINFWRHRQPAVHGESIVLNKETRVLADAYGLMIFMRADSVSLSDLSEEQIAAINTAIGQ